MSGKLWFIGSMLCTVQIAATQRQCGDISNPLLAVPATVTTGSASVTSEQLHPMAASQPTTRVSNGLVGASYRSFEDATLLKMRQVHLAPFFLCLYPCTSCYTSCLKQNRFEKRQEQTGVSHTCSVSEVTTLWPPPKLLCWWTPRLCHGSLSTYGHLVFCLETLVLSQFILPTPVAIVTSYKWLS